MKDISEYKNLLNQQLENIISELTVIGTHNEQTDDWVAIPNQEEVGAQADANTEADVTEEWNERRATLSDLEIEYRNIKRALKKIEDGVYGVCEISGEQIEEKRLDARPDARTCIAHMDDESQLPI